MSFARRLSIPVRRLSSYLRHTMAAQDKNPPKIVKEGKVQITLGKDKEGVVFYNEIQQFNRDLSVLAIREFISTRRSEITEQLSSKRRKSDVEQTTWKAKCLEALSATGIRSVRYFKEIEGVESVVANDMSPQAVASIRQVVEENDLDPEKDVLPYLGNAIDTMHTLVAQGTRFDVIDLDPYGAPVEFLDGAVRAMQDDGMLCVTATDMAVLAGNYPDVCWTKYGAVPITSMKKPCHETALRILLACIQSHAVRQKKYIEPVLSVSVDYYIRVFVRVRKGTPGVKRAGTRLSYLYQCNGCDSFFLQPVLRATHGRKGGIRYTPGVGPVVPTHCEECGSGFQVGGPLWADALHDRAFVRRMFTDLEANEGNYGTSKRMIGLLHLMEQELDAPLYYDVNALFSRMRSNTLSRKKFASALLNAGFHVSLTHCLASGLKTDAPPSLIWNVVRASCADEKLFLPKGSPGERILQHTKLDQPIHFTMHPDAERKDALLAFVSLPPNWGPGLRAGGGGDMREVMQEKIRKGQKDRRKLQPGETKEPYMCSHWKKGVCKYSDEECRYIHAEVEPPRVEVQREGTARERRRWRKALLRKKDTQEL